MLYAAGYETAAAARDEVDVLDFEWKRMQKDVNAEQLLRLPI
jgi:hypothetical protein